MSYARAGVAQQILDKQNRGHSAGAGQNETKQKASVGGVAPIVNANDQR